MGEKLRITFQTEDKQCKRIANSYKALFLVLLYSNCILTIFLYFVNSLSLLLFTAFFVFKK